MARRGRRRGRGSSSAWTWVAIVLLGGVIAAALGTFGWMKLQASQTVSLADDACPVDGATSVTAVLLDTSDAIAPITRLDLQNEFKRVVKDVDKGGLIEVYMLTGNEGELKRTFHACNPGDGSGADPWISNPKKIQKRWEEAFNKPLREIEDRMGTSYESERSPIMAGIQRIVVESLADPKLEDRPKTLFVASDMMEHTDFFSMYKSGANYGTFEKSPARDRFRVPLDGVDVKFLAFQRAASSKIEGLSNFWATWVVANRGNFNGYERLTGIE
ncbi:hypothetical protein GR204_27570 [Rhizobium leguminosarum]|uniref:VWA domain-containing protein n=1 Tax=Rhizobium leguminosarum TaxID=384 RepID=A0A6P0BDU7_RHILE|nr:hypothetical protein [Rhizobium leguminosarum]MBY5846420.1 hypothetical protein [Rhizobium leguminosarum]NEI37678.1 hypothetical protein [Rhizobium leguminosarum]NEI44319.1 hypothetical protein [Rhizobium leguminosarum]